MQTQACDGGSDAGRPSLTPIARAATAAIMTPSAIHIAATVSATATTARQCLLLRLHRCLWVWQRGVVWCGAKGYGEVLCDVVWCCVV